jgi:23S rRNA-/tRNA-specific pseudouridylate synthase
VEVSLETGFLHQIRVSFAHLGFPVAGDRVYGAGAADPTGAPRQLLHAARVAWRDVRAQSPDPPDFVASLEKLRATVP